MLYYDSDGDLLLVLAHRDALRRVFRFVLPDADLVLASVDKLRFRQLATDLGLPVPRSALLSAEGPVGEVADLRFPVVVKPLTRRTLLSLDAAAKAVRFDTPAELVSARTRLSRAGDTLVQELVPGAEDRIESYHAYVDETGSVVGEFTGAKIRTWPPSFGHSCALTTTACTDVLGLGRELLARLGLRGVVKLDLKRDPDGRLWLLEVNPRFTLWHHLGAMAGVNLAALVHADLTGRPRPESTTARAGVTWCDPIKDLRAAHATGLGTVAWLRFAAGCAARSGANRGDLAPLVKGIAFPAARRRSLERLRPGRRQVVDVAATTREA